MVLPDSEPQESDYSCPLCHSRIRAIQGLRIDEENYFIEWKGQLLPLKNRGARHTLIVLYKKLNEFVSQDELIRRVVAPYARPNTKQPLVIRTYLKQLRRALYHYGLPYVLLTNHRHPPSYVLRPKALHDPRSLAKRKKVVHP